MLPFSKLYREIDSTWSTAKCRGRKTFDPWYYIVTCAQLCVSFLSKLEGINVFPKHILKSKAYDQSIHSSKEEIVLSRDNKELFVQRFVKVFDENWKHMEAKSKNRHPSLLYCTVIGLSEADTGGAVQEIYS